MNLAARRPSLLALVLLATAGGTGCAALMPRPAATGDAHEGSTYKVPEQDKAAVRRQEAVADAQEGQTFNVEDEQFDRFEKDLRKALAVALGQESQVPGQPPPESASTVLTALRKTPLQLRIEPVLDQDGNPVNEQFLQLKDSYTTRVTQLSRKLAEGKASRAEMKEVQQGAKYAMKLGDLRQNVLNVSMVTMQSNSAMQTSSMTTLLRVAAMIGTRRQLEMEMNAQDYARVAKWLARERRIETIAALSMGTLAAYQAVINDGGNPRALDALAESTAKAFPVRPTVSEQEARDYVANMKGTAAEVKSRYEAMMRKLHGDAKYEARYKAGVDAMFSQVDRMQNQKSVGQMVSETNAKYVADVEKCKRGERPDYGSLLSPPQCDAVRKATITGDTSDLLPGTKKAFDATGGSPKARAGGGGVGGLLGGLIGKSPLGDTSDAALAAVPGLGSVASSVEGLRALAKGDPKSALNAAIGMVPGGSLVKEGLGAVAKLLF